MTRQRKVQIGNTKGETPRKEQFFNQEDAPDSIESATPERATEGIPMKGVLKFSALPEEQEVDMYASPQASSTRPTTSRGKSRPSPDEFFDYVVPSPQKSEGGAVVTLVFDSPEQQQQHEEEKEEEDKNKNIQKQNMQNTGVPMEPYNDSSSESVMSSDSSSMEFDQDSASMATLQREELVAIGCWLFGSMLAV